MKNILLFLFTCFLLSYSYAQQQIHWKPIKTLEHKFTFNYDKNWNELTNQSEYIVNIPTLDNKFITINFEENTLIPNELKEKFSNLKTYNLTATNNKNITGKATLAPNYIHIDLLINSRHLIFQLNKENQIEAFYKDEILPTSKFECQTSHNFLENALNDINPINGTLIGSERKTYRLALACTYEYAVAVSSTTTPTKLQVFIAMVTTMNRVNGIYEREMGITFQFVPNNDTLIFITNSATTFNNNNAVNLINQVRNFINSRIGNANYDIGHIFSTGGGGLATFRALCDNYSKAQGVTGIAQPYGDPYDVDYVAHEIGHQVGADHTFNRCDNEEAYAAYEPGSGSTIMAYAGICGNQNLQNNSDDYFHAFSKIQMQDWINHPTNATCGTSTTSLISINDFSIDKTYHIPAGTAFELIADSNLIADNYNWYQWNLGNLRSSQLNSATIVNGPTFRSYPSRTNGIRIFPQLDSLLKNNYSYTGERIPTVTRDLKFLLELTKRDNNWGIQRSSDDYITVKVYETTTPFKITAPNTINSYSRNTPLTITWDVGETAQSPINCNNIDLYLSRDNGKTISDTIALQVPNNGNYSYSIPPSIPNGSNYRLKIKCSNNIFLDYNDQPFTINDTTVSIAQLNSIISTLYPNPTTANINLETNIKGNYQVKIFNSQGKIIFESEYNKAKATISMEDNPPGVYSIQILNTYTGEIHQDKFVKL